MDKVVFKLYVTGQTGRALRAIANLRRFCDEKLDGRCEMSVIDVLERPHLAENQRILATPTLIKESPPPARRVIGDLSSIDLGMLGMQTESTGEDIGDE